MTYADDKKSAVIEFNTDMAEGEYIVTVNGFSSSPLTASTVVTAPRLIAIKFQSDVAIKKVIYYCSCNRRKPVWKDMTSRLNSATSCISSRIGATIQNGLITIRGASSDFYKENSKVVVTVIDSTGTVNASASLTVSASAGIDRSPLVS